MNKLLFECDKKKCDHCSFPVCSHTTDIAHAINYRRIENGNRDEQLYIEMAKIPIQQLGLHSRTEKILIRAGIYSTRQLEDLTEDELKAIPGMTKPSIRRIKESFKKFDLYLKANKAW